MKLSGVMLGSEDAKALGEFYVKVFGTPGWQQDDWYGFDVGGGNLMIGPHDKVKGKSAGPERIMITLESEDVKADFARIKSEGADVVAEPYQPDAEKNPNVWLATLSDIDGNYLQIATPWKD